MCFRDLTSGPPGTLWVCGIYQERERGPYPSTMQFGGHAQPGITKRTWFPTQRAVQSPWGTTSIFSSKMHRGLPVTTAADRDAGISALNRAATEWGSWPLKHSEIRSGFIQKGSFCFSFRVGSLRQDPARWRREVTFTCSGKLNSLKKYLPRPYPSLKPVFCPGRENLSDTDHVLVFLNEK